MHISTRHALTLALALAPLTGCTVYRSDCPTANVQYYQDPAYVKVTAPPPDLPAQVEAKPPAPSNGSVWIDGHFVWRGVWVWVDGHWEEPRPGYVWTPPVVDRGPDGYRYHPGYWRPGRVEAAPVYRRPGTVRVTVRPAGSGSASAGGDATVRVRGAAGTTSGGDQGGASVRVRGADGGTTTQNATGTVRVDAQQADPTTNANTTVRVQGANAGTTAATQSQTGVQSNTNVRVDGPGAGNAVDENGPTPPLRCQLRTARAPAGGTITLRGSGLAGVTEVRIGQEISAIQSQRNDLIRVQVPRRSGGGLVEVRTDSETDRCGTLQVIGR